MFISLDGMKPQILYPCWWDYKAIGLDDALVRQAIAETVGNREHRIASSNSSRGGKYCSVLLSVEVASEAQRYEIFAALKRHRDIVMVL